MKWKPYPAYKDSGVEWFGKLPNEWNVTKVRYISDCLDGRRVPLNAEQRADKQGDVPYWGANSIVDYVDEALFDEKLALLGEDGAPFFDRDKPVAFVSNGPVWPNNHVHILRIKPVEATSYVVYALNSVDYSGYIDGSTRDKLTQGQMNAIPLPWPDTELATKIATFLDRETAKLDTLISKQEHLIELLQEKRQAIISHAVTKGLDPDAPMKESGIEWLGKVPAHWKISGFKRLVDIQNGADYKHVEIDDPSQGYPVVGSGGVFAYASEYMFDGPSVLLGRKGTIDKPLFLDCKFWTVDTMYWTKIHKGNDPRFAYYVALSIPFDYYSTSTALPSMTKSLLGSHLIALPSEAEQTMISRYLDDQTEKIDDLINKARQSIDLAKEHRSALISAAVTGKIDVREAA